MESTIIWASALIIIVIYLSLLFRKSINNLFGKVSNIKYGKFGADVATPNQETKETSIFDRLNHEDGNVIEERILNIFSKETLDDTKANVEKETKLHEIKDPQEQIKKLFRYSEAFSVISVFDKIYNSIYGSQLSLLQSLNNLPQTKESLKSFYDVAKEKYPSIYETYSYDDYFNFLISHKLIVENEDKIFFITYVGRDLLKYIVSFGYNINKYF